MVLTMELSFSNTLGDIRHREYTAVGDHVNFAQRLESNASKIDEFSGTLMPPILISQTAERCIRPWLKDKQMIKLYPKGKGRIYTVYGIKPEDFHYELYDMAENQNDWDTAWSRFECGPPKTRTEDG